MDSTMDGTGNIVGEAVRKDKIPLEVEVAAVVGMPLSHSTGAAAAVEVADFDRALNCLEGETVADLVRKRVPVAAASIVVGKGVASLALVFASSSGIGRRRTIRV